MAGQVVLVVVAYLGIGAVDLPSLWGDRNRRGEFWAVLVLLVLGLGLATLITLGYRPVSLWKVVAIIVKPIGTLLFKWKGD